VQLAAEFLATSFVASRAIGHGASNAPALSKRNGELWLYFVTTAFNTALNNFGNDTRFELV